MKNIQNWLMLATLTLILAGCGAASNVGSVTISPQSSTGQLGDGSGSYTIDISVKDGDGQGVANQLITFDVSTTNTGAVSNPAGVTTFSVLAKDMRTDANGFFTVNVTHTNLAGETIYVRAVSESGVTSSWQMLIYTSTGQVASGVTSSDIGAIRINTPDDIQNKLLADGTTSVISDGQVAYTIVIQVEDTAGNFMAGEAVTIAKTGGQGILNIIPDAVNINPAGGYLTDSTGIVSLKITNLNPGPETWTITPHAGGFTTPPSLALSYLGTGNGAAAAGGVTATNELILATTNTGIVADGLDSYLVTLQLQDKYTFVPVANQSVTFIPSGAAGLVRVTPINGTAFKTDTLGILEVKVTNINAKDEVVSLDASYKDNLSNATVNSSNPLKLNFIGLATAAAGGGTSTGFKLTANRIDANAAKDAGRLPADNSTAAKLEVLVTDASTTPATIQTGASVTATFAAGAVTKTISVATNAQGKAVFDVYSDTVGIVDVVFTVAGNAGTSTFTGLEFIQAVKNLTIGNLLYDAQGNPKQNFLAANGEIAELEVFAKDFNNQPVANEVISIRTNGTVSNVAVGATVITDASGRATVRISNSADEVVRVTLITRNGGLLPGVTHTDFIDISFVPTPQQRVNAVTISPDKFSLLTDNSDVINFTVTVLDVNNGAVAGVVVDLYTSAGVLSTSRSTTDATGKLLIGLSSGALRINGLASVKASVNAPNATQAVAGLVSTTVSVSITGSTLVLTPATTVLTTGGSVSTLQMKALDAAKNPINGATITLSQAPVVAGSMTLPALSLTTDVNGLVSTDVYASATDTVGTARLTASGLGGFTVTQDYTVATAANAFAITSPATTSPYSWTTNTALTVTVNNPTSGDNIAFVTDCGTWDGGVSNFITKTGATTLAATLSSTAACTAGVRVINLTKSLTSPLTVTISAASSTATTLALQASRGVLQPNKGAGGESTTLTANVRDGSGNAVGEAWVLFTITNPTGGGESMSNVISQSDAFGRATTTFTAGTQSTGGNGVTLKAEVLGLSVSGTAKVIIGGTPGSVVIGRGSVIFANTATTYRLPMSVMVADTNGNPMNNTAVSLGVWPIQYSTGAYVANGEGICAAAITGTFANEDTNENTFLDTGEDSNGDGQLTPPNSASGTLPATVTTDEFGLATFDLVYPKSSSYWIVDRIRASTLVLGSESTTEVKARLIGEKADVESCFLANSPFSNTNATTVKISLSPQSTVTVGTSAQLSALVVDNYGAPVALQDVSFSFVGTSTGKTLTPTTAKSNIAGIATVVVADIGGSGGPVTVKAVAGTASSQANVTFLTTIADPYSLAVSVSPSSGVIPDGATPAVVTASVTDIYGIAVSGAAIQFKLKSGTASLATFQTVTALNGQATSNLTSFVAGSAVVTVSLLDKYASVDRYTDVAASFGITPAAISLTTSASSVPSGDSSAVTITVLDSGGKAVEGEKVNITSSGGTAVSISQNSITTDVNGQGIITVTDQYSGSVSIQAASNSVPSLNASVGITFTKVVNIVDPYTVTFTNALDNNAAPLNVSKSLDVYTTATAADSYSSYASGLDTVQVTYQVRDVSTGLAGLNVSFATTGKAVISPTSATTGADGKVTVTVTDAYAEVVTVSAVVGGKTGSQQLTFTSLPSSSIQLTSTSPSPAVIGLSGAGIQESASLVFTVVDTNNNPVQGSVLVDFSILNGGLNGGEKLTVGQASTVNGRVTAVMNAGEISGTIQIRASLNTDNTIFTDVPITITGGLPTGDAFVLSSVPLNIHGLDILGVTQDITAHISDFFSNPVSPGQQVQFQTDFANTSGSAVFSDLDVNGVNTGSSKALGFVVSGAPVPVDGFITLEASTIGGGHSKVLTIAAADKNIIYAGTDGGGVFKTIDGGASWFQVGTPLKPLNASKTKDLTGSIVRGLTIAPGKTNFIYAATNHGLFMSLDAGQSWAPKMSRKRIVGDQLGTVATGAVITTANTLNGRLSTAVATTVARFKFNYTHTGSRSRTKVFINGIETQSYHLYTDGVEIIGKTNTTKFTLDGVSITDGDVITADFDTASAVPSLPLWDVVVDKNSTFDGVKGYKNLYAAVYGGGVWKSTDYGQSWAKKTAMLNLGTFDNRVTSLAISPDATVTNSDIFAGTDGGGLYRSKDAAETWERMGNLPNAVIQSVVLDPYVTNQPYRVWVAGKNGVHATADAYSATPTWTAATGFGNNLDIRAIALNDDATYAYAAAYGDITGNSTPLGGVYQAKVGTGSWTKHANLDTATISGAHRIDAIDIVGAGLVATNTVIAGTEGRAVYTSADSGQTWSKKVGASPTALTNTLFTTIEVLHSGTAEVSILPMTTTYQPMNDTTSTVGYTSSANMYHGEVHEFVIRVSDSLGNRLMGGTKVNITADKGTVSGATKTVLPDGTYGSTEFTVQWVNDLPSTDFIDVNALSATLSVEVISGNGNLTQSIGRSLFKPLAAAITVAFGDPYSAIVTASGGSNGAAATPYTLTPPAAACNNNTAGCAATGAAAAINASSGAFYFPAGAGTYAITVQDNATGKKVFVNAVFE